jgi:caspase domain-containing protein
MKLRYTSSVAKFVFISILLFTSTGLLADSKRGLGVSAQTAGTSPEGSSQSGAVTNRALLIGNNNYLQANWPKLKTAHADVEGMARVLTKRYGFEKKDIMLVKDATRRVILQSFDKMADLAAKNDRVLIFYAGHGEFDERKQGYWVPVDGFDTVTYVSNEVILTKIRNIKATHKFLISDSCFSGNLFTSTRSRKDITSKDTKLRSGYYLEKSRLISVQGLSSGGNEPVSDGGERWNGHSIFAFHLLDVLDANRQRYLSASLLGVKLAEIVANDTAALSADGKGQTPILSPIKSQGHQGGEFFFVPTDLGQLKITPLVVFYDPTRPGNQASFTDEMKSIIEKAVHKELKQYDIKILKQVTLSSNDKKQEMTQVLKENKAEGALVYSISGKVEKKITMMYQRITYLTIGFQAYQFTDGQLSHLSDTELKPQIVTIRKWTTDPTNLEKYFLKVANKTVSKWSGEKKDSDVNYQIHRLMAQLETE